MRTPPLRRRSTPSPLAGEEVSAKAEAGEGEGAGSIAAGVWSKTLAQRLGENLPVEAERGYNLTYPSRQGLISRPLVLADRGVVATALTPGLRLGGWTELGGIELPLDLLDVARHVFILQAGLA